MTAKKFEFIQACLEYEVMRFGKFTLKSGRVSPYFFNAGYFNSGQALSLLGRHYAHHLCESALAFDMLFGPAYKGIPLVSAAAIGLADHHQRNVSYAFNRKEAKDHGEGGQIVGAPLQGRVVIVDDVITAGTAIAASVELLQAAGASLAGVVVLLDRQERGDTSAASAVTAIEQRYQIPVLPVITLTDIMTFVEQNLQWQSYLGAMQHYQQQWCVHR